MKKFRLLFLIIPVLAAVFLLKGLIIQSPNPEDCELKEMTVSKIYEGGVKDIVFANANGDFYYINRGLERGFTLAEMEQKVLNKKVTLHLAKTVLGTSNHIAQLAVENDVIFTEF
ncbi:MAG: hypothetical protein AAF489_04290 [Bacteroidota bacterium]